MLTDTTPSQRTSVPGSIAFRVARVRAFIPAHAGSWVVLVFALGTALSAGLQRHLDPTQGTQRLIELDIGEAFAFAAVLSLVLARPGARPGFTRMDLGVLVLGTLTWFLPEPHAVYAGMTLAAVWLLARHARDRQLADLGQIWLALSLCELWSKLVFKLFYQAIEPFEVAAMAWVGRFAFPGLHVTGAYLSTRPDWSVVMLEGCSAFHNLSLAGLIWLCVLKIAGRRVGGGALGALAASAVLVVAINIARILVMLPSRDAYAYWHDEAGSVTVALASVAASLLPIVIYVERSQCPTAQPA